MVLSLGEEAALRVMLTLTTCLVLKTDRCGFTSALGGNRQTCVAVVDVQSLTSSIRRRVTSSQSPQMLDDMTVQLQAAGRRHQTAPGQTGARSLRQAVTAAELHPTVIFMTEGKLHSALKLKTSKVSGMKVS